MAYVPETTKRGVEWWQIAVGIVVALSWLGVSGVALLR